MRRIYAELVVADVVNFAPFRHPAMNMQIGEPVSTCAPCTDPDLAVLVMGVAGRPRGARTEPNPATRGINSDLSVETRWKDRTYGKYRNLVSFT
jgi:hypothetical protein